MHNKASHNLKNIFSNYQTNFLFQFPIHCCTWSDCISSSTLCSSILHSLPKSEPLLIDWQQMEHSLLSTKKIIDRAIWKQMPCCIVKNENVAFPILQKFSFANVFRSSVFIRISFHLLSADVNWTINKYLVAPCTELCLTICPSLQESIFVI